eukprot:jgi/Chrzof1/8696/Cz03g21010.t1
MARLLYVSMLVLALAVAANAQQFNWRRLGETAPHSAAATAPKATGTVAEAEDRKPKRPRGDNNNPTFPPVVGGKNKLKFEEVGSVPIVLPGNSSVVLFIGCSNLSFVPVSCGVITDLNGATPRPAAAIVGPALTPAITPGSFIPAVYSCFLRYDATTYGAAGAEFVVFNPNADDDTDGDDDDDDDADNITFRIQVNCVGSETDKDGM